MYFLQIKLLCDSSTKTNKTTFIKEKSEKRFFFNASLNEN